MRTILWGTLQIKGSGTFQHIIIVHGGLATLMRPQLLPVAISLCNRFRLTTKDFSYSQKTCVLECVKESFVNSTTPIGEKFEYEAIFKCHG
jgi:hypothetical protein